MQSSFATETLRTFIHAQMLKTKVIFSFILQKQLKQTNFMTDIIRTFIDTMDNKQSVKVRKFSFMLQRQGIKPNFMTHKIRNFIQAIFNGDNAKLKLFSLIHKRQRIQIKKKNIPINATKKMCLT